MMDWASALPQNPKIEFSPQIEIFLENSLEACFRVVFAVPSWWQFALGLHLVLGHGFTALRFGKTRFIAGKPSTREKKMCTT